MKLSMSLLLVAAAFVITCSALRTGKLKVDAAQWPTLGYTDYTPPCPNPSYCCANGLKVPSKEHTCANGVAPRVECLHGAPCPLAVCTAAERASLMGAPSMPVPPIPKEFSPLNHRRMKVQNGTSISQRGAYVFPRLDARMHDGDEIQMMSAVHNSWLSYRRMLLAVGEEVEILSMANNKLCVATGHGVKCQEEDKDKATKFEAVDAGTGRIGLTYHNAQGDIKYCASYHDKFACDATDVFTVPQATFLKVEITHKTFGLQDTKGHFCRVKEDGSMICDATELSKDCEFKPVIEQVGGAEIHQTLDSRFASTFVVLRADLNSNTIALFCKDVGLYVMVRPDHMLTCNSPTPRSFRFERPLQHRDARVGAFEWDPPFDEPCEDQEASERRYISAPDPTMSTMVTANGDDPNGFQSWQIYLTAGYEQVRPLVRGVNLANWFVLNKEMQQTMFFDQSGRPFQDICHAIDEHALMESLGREAAAQRMKEHWETWITEEDICWLARSGINSVRVPVGYWMVFPDGPFIEGQYEYLQRLFQWCERYNVAVLLDFHGLKGSQNGKPSSGNCGACGADQCGSTKVDFLESPNRAINLAVIANLTQEFSNSPVFLGFEVANEVVREVPSGDLFKFYQDAYEVIRAWSPSSMDVMAHTHRPSDFPWQNFHDMYHDAHIYFPRNIPGGATMNAQENLRKLRDVLFAVRRWPVIVGEWSILAIGHRPDDFWPALALTQLQAYEQHSQGWFYNAYKTAYPNSTWNYRDQCMMGRLPGCTWSQATYASSNWWNTPTCAYAYLDGPCDPVYLDEQEQAQLQKEAEAEEEAARRREEGGDNSTQLQQHPGNATQETNHAEFVDTEGAVNVFELHNGTLEGRLYNADHTLRFERHDVQHLEIDGKRLSWDGLHSSVPAHNEAVLKKIMDMHRRSQAQRQV